MMLCLNNGARGDNDIPLLLVYFLKILNWPPTAKEPSNALCHVVIKAKDECSRLDLLFHSS